MKVTKSARKSSSVNSATYVAKPKIQGSSQLSSTTAGLDLEFDGVIVVDKSGTDLTVDFVDYGDLTPAPNNKTGYYYDETTNAKVMDFEAVHYIILDAIEVQGLIDPVDIVPGEYHISGEIVVEYKLDDVYKDSRSYGVDDQGDAVVDTDYYADDASVEILSAVIYHFQISEAGAITSSTDIDDADGELG